MYGYLADDFVHGGAVGGMGAGDWPRSDWKANVGDRPGTAKRRGGRGRSSARRPGTEQRCGGADGSRGWGEAARRDGAEAQSPVPPAQAPVRTEPVANGGEAEREEWVTVFG